MLCIRHHVWSTDRTEKTCLFSRLLDNWFAEMIQGQAACLKPELTLVMAHQLLQGSEGDAGRDVESSIVQRSDLIMFNCVSRMSIAVPDGQRVAACGEIERTVTQLVATHRGLL